MAEVTIPDILPGSWHGVMIEAQTLAGTPLWAVTIRIGLGRAPRRRWFADRSIALAHAAEQADAYGVPLIGLGIPDEEA